MRITIGDAATYTIAAAQAEAAAYKAQTNKGIDPRQVRADGLAAHQAKVEAIASEAEAKQTQDRHETLTLDMAWPLYVESRRKRWSAWHIRDHENVVRTGGVKKVRG